MNNLFVKNMLKSLLYLTCLDLILFQKNYVSRVNEYYVSRNSQNV